MTYVLLGANFIFLQLFFYVTADIAKTMVYSHFGHYILFWYPTSRGRMPRSEIMYLL